MSSQQKESVPDLTQPSKSGKKKRRRGRKKNKPTQSVTNKDDHTTGQEESKPEAKEPKPEAAQSSTAPTESSVAQDDESAEDAVPDEPVRARPRCDIEDSDCGSGFDHSEDDDDLRDKWSHDHQVDDLLN